MNYFDFLNFTDDCITVLGVDENSDFVNALKEFTENKITINTPDVKFDKLFYVHSEEEIEDYKSKGLLIGVVDVNVLEKKICEVVENTDYFCSVNNLFDDELIYPLAFARVIENREKYDILYINGVNSEGKRYLARELAKRLRNGMGIRLINTDSDYVETLVKS